MVDAPPLPAQERIAAVRAVLDDVPDPEIPVLSIAEIGMLRDVVVDADGTVEVVITPTYSGCPAMGMISSDIGLALAKAGIEPYRVVMRHKPAWTTDWIPPAARERMRVYGIAPPVEPSASKQSLFTQETVACPRCSSEKTERISEFGATACKAFYRCTSCLEPFEYFKCVRP